MAKRGEISTEAWRKGLAATQRREQAAAARVKPGDKPTIATEYDEIADRAQRDRLADMPEPEEPIQRRARGRPPQSPQR